MSVHPNGSGTGWTNVESVDVDQPHGKDYLYCQHIAKGIRKRMNAEHAAFADATVGGIHKPGGCAVLGIEDGTATVIADGTVVGHGIIWDNTEALWCCTAAAGASTTGDWTILQMNPNTQWKGGDVTWAGNHQFDASVDFSDVDITGSLLVDSSADFSHAFFDGTVIATNLEVTGAAIFDGTSNFYDEVDFSVLNVGGTLAVTGAVTKANLLGSTALDDDDTNAMLTAHAYLCNQDGIVEVIITEGASASLSCYAYDDTDNNPAAGGAVRGVYLTAAYGQVGSIKCFSFSMQSGRYFEVVVSNCTATIRWCPFGTLIKCTDQD